MIIFKTQCFSIRLNLNLNFCLRRDLAPKEIATPEHRKELSEEQERLVEAGRQDTTTVVNVSVTIYTTVQYRYKEGINSLNGNLG